MVNQSLYLLQSVDPQMNAETEKYSRCTRVIWQISKNLLNINLLLQVKPVHILYNAYTTRFITTARSDTWEYIARDEAIVHIQIPFLPSQMYI